MFVELLPLALGSAIYPTLLALVVLIVGRPNPQRLLLGFFAGAMTTSLTIGSVIVFSLDGADAVGGNDKTVGPGINFVIALLLLVLLWALATDRDAGLRERRAAKKHAKAEGGEVKDPWSERLLQRDSIWIAYLVGMVLNLPGALYIVALKDIAAADISAAEAFGNIVFYNVIMFQWAEIPLIGYRVAPERTALMVASFNDWVSSHLRRIGMVLCGVAAVYLIAQGISDLS